MNKRYILFPYNIRTKNHQRDGEVVTEGSLYFIPLKCFDECNEDTKNINIIGGVRAYLASNSII